MTQQTCELPGTNPATDEVREILRNNKVVAMVGLSPRQERDSNIVARYLMEHGYQVIP